MFEQIKEYVRWNKGTLVIYGVTAAISIGLMTAAIVTGHSAFASRGH
jgi:hypothetical protein